MQSVLFEFKISDLFSVFQDFMHESWFVASLTEAWYLTH